MITSVNRSLAEQIVNTIKDVCNYDINLTVPALFLPARILPGLVLFMKSD